MKFAPAIFAATLTAAFTAPILAAQQPAPEAAQLHRYCANATTDSVHTFFLHNVSQPSDANEIYTAIRNLLPPDAKSFLVSSQNTIFVCANPEQFALAQKIITDLDRPKKNYRLTYTVSEMDGTRRLGNQHYAVVLAAGQQTTLKLGSKVPVSTGSYSSGSSALPVQTQFTYLDVGMNFTATLTDLGTTLNLQTQVEQSSVAEDKSNAGEPHPIIRQTSLKGESILTPGKPLMLGSLDIPGSTRHLDIEVTMDPLP